MTKAVIFDMYETLITHYRCPLYFGKQMAADAGISEDKFRESWSPTEYDRSIGKMTLEDAIEIVLVHNKCYSKELLDTIVRKRIDIKEEGFRHIHTDIIPLFESLKKKGIKIGLISNCFSEEAEVIEKSILYPYFDAVCLSYREGIVKPDKEIFTRCIERLNVKAEECLYVGDGGSQELEAASALGMKALQAVWYFIEDGRKQGFKQVEKPFDLMEYL